MWGCMSKRGEASYVSAWHRPQTTIGLGDIMATFYCHKRMCKVMCPVVSVELNPLTLTFACACGEKHSFTVRKENG
jgi:hypothetical protein